MSAEENTAIARRWFSEGWAGNLALADGIFTDNFRNNGMRVGPDGPKRNVANRLAGFPTVQCQIEQQIAVDNHVVTRLRWRGTHTGMYSGLAATGRAVNVLLIAIWRFEAGKAVENWSLTDQFGLFQQLGVLPGNLLGAQVGANTQQAHAETRVAEASESAKDARTRRTTTDENAAIVRRWLTEGARGNLALADAYFASDFRTNGMAVGTAGPKRNVTNRLTGFPDFESRIEQQIAHGDFVVTRLTWRGTQRGMYSGVPPTGKQVEVMAITIFHFENGKVIENWTVIDQFSLFRQLGALPPNLLGAHVPAETATLYEKEHCDER